MFFKVSYMSKNKEEIEKVYYIKSFAAIILSLIVRARKTV